MTILVQSFLNSATKLSTTATTATTVAQLKTLVNALEGVNTSTMQFYIINPSTTSTVLVSGTLGSYGITTATTIYSSNTISSTATTKVARQLAKLGLAQLRRQAAGNTTTNYYRSRNIYDIDLLADKYTSNTSTVGTTSTLVISRPWISAPAYTIVTSGLRLYLDAGNSSSYNGSGASWVDLSTNTNNATLVGSPAFTSAGASSYFTFPNNSGKYATTPAAKYGGTYTGKTTFFVARMDAGIADGYHGIFGVNPNRTFNTYIYKQAGPVYQVHASFGGVGTNGWSNNLTLSAGQWFTFGAVQAANGNITFYFNGVAVGVTTGLTLTNTYSSGTDPQLIGKADDGTLWHGDVAVVTVYDRALSGAEMTQNHNAILGRYGL
jgi:hypothetical protein